jgi:hypothetical protein
LAEATHSTQKCSFMSESLATSWGLQLHSQPKDERRYYKPLRKDPKYDKNVKTTKMVQVSVVYFNVSIPDQKFYIVPQGESLETDIVVGIGLAARNKPLEAEAPLSMPLAIRAAVPGGYRSSARYQPSLQYTNYPAYSSAAGLQNQPNYPDPRPLMSDGYAQQDLKAEGTDSIRPVYHSGSTTSENESNRSPLSDAGYSTSTWGAASNPDNYTLHPGDHRPKPGPYQSSPSTSSETKAERVRSETYVHNREEELGKK